MAAAIHLQVADPVRVLRRPLRQRSAISNPA